MLKKIPMKILMTSLILLNSIYTERVVKEEKNRTISASCQEPEAEGKIYKLAACYRARTSFPTSKLQFFKSLNLKISQASMTIAGLFASFTIESNESDRI